MLAKWIEEATGVHFTKCGIQVNKEIMWVITWSYFKIIRLPEKEERIIIKSWQNKKRGMLYPRKSIVYTKNGEKLVEAAQYFVQLDTKSRKLSVTNNEMDKIPGIKMTDEPQIPSLQVAFPDRLLKKMVRIVKKEHIDKNGHMNNTSYIEWLEELFVVENLDFKLLKSVWIEYKKELSEGALVEIQYLIQTKKVYVCGIQNKEEYFRCVAELIDRKEM